MLTYEKIMEQFKVFENHVEKYDNEFRKANILPKNHSWRPYRWCSRDIVFALIVVRHERFRNCLEADVCLMSSPPQYPENSGAKVAMGFLLSEAYKCGTSMEIVFSENVETRIEDGKKKGRVPAYIYDLACDFDIKLKHVLEGHITPFEARQIYMKLVGFSKEAQEKIMKLSVDEKISPERACFVVMGGIWSLAEAESIILGSDNPESILLSASSPEDRHLYLRDVLSARGAILGGALDRKLLKKEIVKDGEASESEDIEVEMDISFDGETYAKAYKAIDECCIPWTAETDLILKPEERMVVVVRARSSSEIIETFEEDLICLSRTIEKYKTKEPTMKFFFLVPRDFEEIPSDKRIEMENRIRELGALLMTSPESVARLDKEAMRRIETGRMVRHE